MTRLEISFLFPDLPEYSFNQPGMKTQLQQNATRLIDRLVTDVMNNSIVLKELYKSLNFFKFVHNFGLIKNNILVIGSKQVWMVNCATNHKSHFVGTERSLQIRRDCANKDKWR